MKSPLRITRRLGFRHRPSRRSSHRSRRRGRLVLVLTDGGQSPATSADAGGDPLAARRLRSPASTVAIVTADMWAPRSTPTTGRWREFKANVSGGRIVFVDVLQYPADRRTSKRINSEALPALESEAISAQSAQVDIVSGATLTSEAYARSLNRR